jgi:hypothetical protein
MKKKLPLEADLDPAGTRHSRPGSKIADAALAASKKPRKKTSATAAPSRPGSTAAARAVDATRRKPTRK